MALTRIDSYLVDLDSLGGITFDDQAGTPTLKVDATTHRVGIGTAAPLATLDVRGNIYNISPNWIGHSNYTHLKFSDNFIELRATSISVNGVSLLVDGSTKDLLARVFTSGSFVNNKIWHAGNDGVGSGLDADLLDGKQGFEYLSTDNTQQTKTGNLILGGNLTVDTDVLVVNSLTNNVGIGTTNPTTNFHVVGSTLSTNFRDIHGSWNVNLGSNQIEGRGVVAGYSGGAYSGIGYNIRHSSISEQYFAPGGDTASYLRFDSGGFRFFGANTGEAGRTLSLSHLMTVSMTGYVGIGTNNPITTLDIRSASNEAMYIRRSDNANAYGILGISGSNIFRLGSYVAGTGWGDISFNDTIRFTSTGNVGIGTAIPSEKLHVYTGASVGAIARFEGKAGRTLYTGIDPLGHYIEVQGTNPGERVLRTQVFDGSTGYAQVFLDGANKYLYTSSNVNVGIGTTNPTSGLQVTKSGTLFFQDSVWMQPAGNTLITAIGSFGQNNWIGIPGHYYATTGSANILLQANFGDLGSHAGHYISSTATGVGASYFSIGRILASGGVGTPAVKEPQLNISSSGNVGIGTTNPQSKLHVDGTSQLISDSSAPSSSVSPIHYIASGNSSDSVALEVRQGRFNKDVLVVSSNQALSANLIRAHDNGTDRFVLTGSGNVGICTTSPQRKLHIYAPGVDLSVIRLSGSAVLQTEYDIRQGIVGVSNAGFSIYDVNATSTRVAIDSAGNVGIGSANPPVKFAVLGSNTVARIESSTTYVDLQLANSQSSAGYIQYYYGDLRFFASSGSTPTMTISGGSPGNVGIGTTNPQSSLDLKIAPATSTISTLGYSANASLNIRIPNVTGNVGQIVFTNNDAPTAGYASIGVIMTSGAGVGLGDIIMSTKSNTADAASQEHLRITSTGNVGIGTTNPVSKLDVRGDIFTSGVINQSNGEQQTSMRSGSVAFVESNTWYDTGLTFAFQYNLIAFMLFLSFENNAGDGNNTTALFMSPGTNAYAGGGTSTFKIAGAPTLEAQIVNSSPYALQVRTTSVGAGAGEAGSKLRWWILNIPGN